MGNTELSVLVAGCRNANYSVLTTTYSSVDVMRSGTSAWG